MGANEAKATFSTFVSIGAQLMQLHLGYENAPEYALRWVETAGRAVFVARRKNEMGGG